MSKTESEDPNVITYEVVAAPGQVSNIVEYKKSDGTILYSMSPTGVQTVTPGTKIINALDMAGTAYSGTQVIAAIAALPVTGGTVYLSAGTWTFTAVIDVPAHITVRGAGDATVIHDYGFLIGEAGCTIEDMSFTGSYTNGYAAFVCTPGSDATFRNLSATLDNTHVAAFGFYANASTLDGIYIENCRAIDCDCMGFFFGGEGIGPKIKNVWIINSVAVNCGRAARYTDWDVGFSLAEQPDVENMFVVGCSASGSWESGFHFEDAPTKTNVQLIGCRSYDNGQKTGGAVYGAGFLVSPGITLSDCVSMNNARGYTMGNVVAGVLTINNCRDTGSGCSLKGGGSVGAVHIDGFVSEGATTNPIYTPGLSNVRARNVCIYDPVGDVTNGYCAIISAVGAFTSDNLDWELNVSGGTGAGVEFLILANGATNLRLRGHLDCSDDVSLPIYSDTSDDLLIEDMTIFAHGGGTAIYVGADCTNVLIKNTHIEDRATIPNLAVGVDGGGVAVIDKDSVICIGVTAPFVSCLFRANSGTSTGTGAQQTVAHGLVATPTDVILSEYTTGLAIPYQSAAADATNIYVLATLNKTWAWRAKV